MLIGIQGSGKTTFATEFEKNNNCLIASTDYVRKNNLSAEQISVQILDKFRVG